MYLLDIGIYLVKYAPTSNNTIENNQVKAPPNETNMQTYLRLQVKRSK